MPYAYLLGLVPQQINVAAAWVLVCHGVWQIPCPTQLSTAGQLGSADALGLQCCAQVRFVLLSLAEHGEEALLIKVDCRTA
jgi:hypothetical protein